MAHCACVSSQSLFPPALETLHQPATYHHLHTVVDSTMALTPRRTLSRAAAWAHTVTTGNAWWQPVVVAMALTPRRIQRWPTARPLGRFGGTLQAACSATPRTHSPLSRPAG